MGRQSYTKMMVSLASELNKPELTLEYNIRQTKSAQIWSHSLSQSIENSKLREDRRFYHLSKSPESELSDLVHRLKKNIADLKVLHPEIHFYEIDQNNLQDSVNRLHTEFAEGHLIKKIMTEKNLKHWEDFNVLIHTIDSALGNQKSVEKTGLANSRIVFTWDDPHKVEIPEDCYKDFCVNFVFGVAYANYSQVGRQIIEMYLTQDHDVPDEHIQPSRFMSGNTVLWFGPTAGHTQNVEFKKRVEKWYQENLQKFEKLGLRWGDPKLSLGQIPVAYLSEPIYSVEEVRENQKMLSGYDRVSSITIL